MKRVSILRTGSWASSVLLASVLLGCGEAREPQTEHAAPAAGEHAGHAMEDVQGIEGRAPVHLDAAKRQLVNIRTAAVTRDDVQKTIRTVGIVTYNTSRLADVNTKIMGWVQKLYVDTPGQRVRRGQPLMDMYSPELYSGQEEYLLAYRHYRQLQTRIPDDTTRVSTRVPFEHMVQSLREAESLMESARKRLRLWDISDGEIERIEETDKPSDTLTMTSPVTGFVVEKNVDPGQMVKAGATLYRVADLSNVWVNADLYEYELHLVHVGQKTRVTLPAYPDWGFEGTVDFIYPYLESKTRTTTIRLVLPNSDGLLKPDMYANVEIDVPLGPQLVVHPDAVLDTGTRQYVFVEASEGMFVPRLVKLGVKAGERFVVLDGLEEGEKIVVDGNFLLDSESQLKAFGTTEGHKH